MTTKVRPEPTIPDHDVYRKIGGGAYGEVWLAEAVTGALRAVKVVWHDDFEDERGFEREFEGIEKYEPVSRDHPSLVRILHVGRGESEGEAFYYYVMELGDDVESGREINPVEYEARTLRSDMLRADKTPLDVDFCIEVGRALAEGLSHLHQAGLAHRDVKPANVIFVEGKAKLADIGLVALRDQRTFVGTEGFVPPEGPGSAPADVYSLGKVLYEMATGKDRLDFPELPDELPHGKSLKRWRALNGAICEVCEPRLSKRTITTAGALAKEMERLQSGRRRPVRMNRSAVAAVVVAMMAVVLTWQFPNISNALSSREKVPVVPLVVLPEVSVTVTSLPTGAEVYDAEGNYIADTPLEQLSFPLGTELEYVFRLDGFHPKKFTVTITSDLVDEVRGRIIIAPTLEIFAPPVDGDPWEDILGASYKGVENYHISNYYVGKLEWQEYCQATQVTAGVFVTVSENGVQRDVVFCLEQEAQRFSDWLEEKSQDGYLTADHEMEPRMDRDSSFQDLNEEIVKSGGRPFRMVVRRIPYAHLMFTSTPTGADVYLDGHWRGVTPLLGDPAGTGIKVNPNAVEVVLEREGFERERRAISLSNDEKWSEPMHFDLRQSAGVIFGREWTNSLEMKLVPLNADLMVAVWETRVKDYRAYVTKADANRPRTPEFAQTDEHPVVYVSPDDARKFCKWLTETEKGQGLIAANHHYRLPTDREWSEMVGLGREQGDWPVERGDPPAGEYPWGNWPPGEVSGNFSDGTAVTEGAQPINKSIGGYEDGFAYTAPVGNTLPNAFGIYDLGGNVHEWVDEAFAPGQAFSVTRGGGWNTYQRHTLDSSFRNPVNQAAGVRDNIYGFRVVLAKKALVLEAEETEIESEEYNTD